MDAAHWDEAHGTLGARGVSRARDGAGPSLDLLRFAPAPVTLAIDIGSGASPLSGVLLGRGVDDVAVLDISASALAMARTSLGERAAHVQWIRADLRT